MHFGVCCFAPPLAALWGRQHLAFHIPYPATHIPHSVSYHLTPAPSIPHPMWDLGERGLGPLPVSTGCTLLVPGKLEGSQGALISGYSAQSAKSQQKAWPPVSREGLCGGTACSSAPSFLPALGESPDWVEEAASMRCILPGPASPGLGCAFFTGQAVNKHLSVCLAWVSPWLPSLPPRLQEIWAAKSLPWLPVSLLGAGKKTRQSWGGGKVCRKLNCKAERQFQLSQRVLNFLVGKIKGRVWICSLRAFLKVSIISIYKEFILALDFNVKWFNYGK